MKNKLIYFNLIVGIFCVFMAIYHLIYNNFNTMVFITLFVGFINLLFYNLYKLHKF